MGQVIADLLRAAEAPVGTIDEAARSDALTGLSALLARDHAAPVYTSVIGSQPNPSACKINRLRPGVYETSPALEAGTDVEALVEAQARDNIRQQEGWGIGVLSEGELFRNDRLGSAYITYLAGACTGMRRLVPMDPGPVIPYKHPSVVIVDELQWRGPLLLGDFVRAQQHTQKPVKINIPGPLSFARRIMNVHYADWRAVGWAVTRVVQAEIASLVAAGCRWIQIDEPHLTWEPPECVEAGLQWLEQVLSSASGATTVLHMCRSNPYAFTRSGSSAADRPYYSAVAASVAKLPVDVVSIEEPCTQGSLELSAFAGKRIMLGVLDVTRPEAESVDDLVATGKRAQQEIPVDKLMFSPKCGMLHMPPDIATAKVNNMVQAIHRLL